MNKVEIEVRTPLSSRQKYYYDMLKRRVTSAAELLDNKMSKDDKRMHSLMNLVMQFRKVSFHTARPQAKIAIAKNPPIRQPKRNFHEMNCFNLRCDGRNEWVCATPKKSLVRGIPGYGGHVLGAIWSALIAKS